MVSIGTWRLRTPAMRRNVSIPTDELEPATSGLAVPDFSGPNPSKYAVLLGRRCCLVGDRTALSGFRRRAAVAWHLVRSLADKFVDRPELCPPRSLGNGQIREVHPHFLDDLPNLNLRKYVNQESRILPHACAYHSRRCG